MATEADIQAVDPDDVDIASDDAEVPKLEKAIEWSENVATILYQKAQEIADLHDILTQTLETLQLSRDRLAENVEGDPIDAIDTMIDKVSQLATHIEEASEPANEMGPAATELRDALTSFREAAEGHKTARGRVLNPDWLLEDD